VIATSSLFWLFLLRALAGAETPARAESPANGERLLVFTRTTGFRHDSIPDAVAAVRRVAAESGLEVDATEDPTVFHDASLASYRAVVFLLTTGDVLDGDEQAAFERWLAGGRGFVGVHSATDTEYDWPFYGELVGSYFAGHPAIQPATIRVVDRTHPSTAALPEIWHRTDEWYDFRVNPRPRVHVLLTIDESTYSGGSMGADHPIAWCREYAGGRAFYTAGGHTRESYVEPLFVSHLAGGIRWAAGLESGFCGPVGRVDPRRVTRGPRTPRAVTARPGF
jgi:type 1 glutamine amidotransferase